MLQYSRCSEGFSLLEMLTVLAMIGIFIGFTHLNLTAFENPADNGANALMGFLKQARAKALASTRAYTVKPLSVSEIITTYGTTCATNPQTTDTGLSMDLPSRASLVDTNWSICYSSRGLSSTSADILVHDESMTRTVQVVLGGGVRVL